ncbi:hypothetical protein [Vagococcus hydrophili]|uniref:Uncharacterized protein n=1 Tax=Vagococcus hydrophili TaxID=2714947 RepID=A0A6G8AU49_9ENTE|nr:hypothetical protein [Vagococcus hydrophili]QIL48510.1 hypothetical protein G7082_08355 [Vagococcus hydrophili]
MNGSKKKVCKYPKCQKEIPGEKGVFCSHHKKSVKEKSEAAITILGATGAFLLTVIKKKD